MNILLSTDNNYVMPTGVLMHSIGENNGSDVSYHIMTNTEFSSESRASLKRVAEKYGSKISFYTITEEMTRALPFGRDDQPKHVSIATYYRLFITEILPSDVHKIIYLDGDMIVRHNLQDLWNTDLAGVAVGVVHDCDEDSQSKDNRLPYPMETGYFNAGMLLINLDYWRENGCFDTFMSFISDNIDKIIFHDQDVLNSVFWNSRRWVSVTYNFQSSFIHLPKYRAEYSKIEDDIAKHENDPTIIHYVSSTKPWTINCFFPMRGTWRRYWKLSEWYKDGLKDDNPKTIKEYLRNWALKKEIFFPSDKFKKIIIRK